MTRLMMLVDDELHALRVIKMALENAGYEVKTFPNGLEAFEALAELTPDALITDIQMPKMDGESLCKAITEKYPERDYQIYVLTSRTEIEHRIWSQAIPRLEFMEKPISIKNLLGRLNNHFENLETNGDNQP